MVIRPGAVDAERAADEDVSPHCVACVRATCCWSGFMEKRNWNMNFLSLELIKRIAV